MIHHGDINITWHGNLLCLHAFGPFNEEGVKRAASQYKAAILANPLRCFSVIEIWDKNSLTSPEGFTHVGALWSELAEHNCIALALVVSNTVQQVMAEQRLPAIGKIFKRQQEAEEWIAAQAR